MLSTETLKALVEQATTAPSSYNTQPWRFRAGADAIDLWADRTRALPVNDPHDRELTISCGAALMSLRVAAAVHGLATKTHILPEGPAFDWLARVEVSDGPVDAELATLGGWLVQRRTYRKAFAGRPVAAEVRQAVEQAARSEGATLITLDHAQKDRAAELVAAGDRQQWDAPRWRRELAMWMHPRRQGDGLTIPALAAPLAQAVVRTFDLGNGVAAKDQQLASGSPWLTLLLTDADDVQAWLTTGQALQRALLTGSRHGLQASYLNQPIQVATLRPQLQALAGTSAFPQILMRWGHPTDVLPASPRRPVDAVLERSA
ncbi:MAG: Acg family FMN-binding oxidoreductase [Thiobacillaceae bacterium]